MPFNPARMKLRLDGETWVVDPVKIKWLDTQNFSVNASNPTSPGYPLVGAPFKTGKTSPSADGAHRVAMLSFDATLISTWHQAFDDCIIVTQAMDVDGVGIRDLTIELACLTHTKSVFGTYGSQVARAADGVASASADLVQALFSLPKLALRRLTGGSKSDTAELPAAPEALPSRSEQS